MEATKNSNSVAINTEKLGTESAVTSENQLEIPLLEDLQLVEKPQKTPAQKVIRKTFKKTAILSNLLPSDSFRDERGKVRYGLATFRGLWIIDGSSPPEDAAIYKLKFIDFFHAFLSILVFCAVAAFDQNVMKCLYPSPSPDAQEILAILPMAVGVICTFLFVVFPTTRHGIGFPLSRC
ncbi:protein DMP6-like [Solanum stenotomum]|uniref:protein DMP6-like n=1 Tax=Solanum stenotomum TaxID=172797 RepID=UPI0020D030D8|nr:protein DMP6-like [Solanum stenotomum]